MEIRWGQRAKKNTSDIHDVKKLVMPFLTTEDEQFKYKCISSGPKCDRNRSGDLFHSKKHYQEKGSNKSIKI
jgi:hypothetical protein